MVYGAVPVKDEENPLLGVRSSSKRPRSFAYGVIAVVCVAALAISGFSRSTDRSSRGDLSALGDLSNDYLAKRSWWQEVKTANETLITAKQASDNAMEAAAEAEEKVDELVLDAEEKDRMCTDIHKAEDQTSGCDDHCSTGAVQASRLGGSSSWFAWWWLSVVKKALEAAKKAAEAKKAKCMETCKSLECGLPKCLSKTPIQTGGANGSYGKKKQYYAFSTMSCPINGGSCRLHRLETFDDVQKMEMLKPNSSCKFGSRCYSKAANYHGMHIFYLWGRGRFTDPCEFGVSLAEDHVQTIRIIKDDMPGNKRTAQGIGSDYFSECGKCTD